MNSEKLGIDEAKEVIRLCYKHKKPVYISGPPGVGKSDMIREVAAEDKLELRDTRLSQLDNVDLRGLPNITDNRTHWSVPNFLPTEGAGILFFDEFSTANQSVQAACLQLILDRRLGDYKLPDGWLVVGAGNRSEDLAQIYELSAPLANRFVHIQLDVPTPDEWVEWAKAQNIDERVINFIQKNSSQLFKFDSDRFAVEKAFPTPRSVALLGTLIKDVHDRKLMKTLAESTVGSQFALSFIEFTKNNINASSESLRDYYDEFSQGKHSVPTDAGQLHQLVQQVQETYRRKRHSAETKLLIASRLPSEFQLLLARETAQSRGKETLQFDEFKKLQPEIQKTIKEFIANNFTW